MCNTHYHAWWVRQPKENRNPLLGRPKKEVVSYWGMHSRLKINRGFASEHKCVDCEAPADDWSWVGNCSKTLYGLGRVERVSDNPYCLHFEHYEPRCTKCHSALDSTLPIKLEV
jgi:hypothetical protein